MKFKRCAGCWRVARVRPSYPAADESAAIDDIHFLDEFERKFGTRLDSI